MEYASYNRSSGQNMPSAVMVASALVLAGFGALAVRQLMKSRDRSGYRHVRSAGTRDMIAPPRQWDEVDEQLDESFPASDPPGNY